MSAPAATSGLAPVTIISGGSKGIGRELAFEFARGRNDLLLIARDPVALHHTAEEIRSACGVRVDVLSLDLARRDAAAVIELWLKDNRFYCRHLVNNAGVGLAGDFAAQSEAGQLAMLDVNVRVLTELTRRLLPDMLARREGGVLNVASLGGLVAGPYQAAYYASKAYVLSLTQALSWECWRSGVRICALAPGPVKTSFHARMGASRAYYTRLGAGISAERVARSAYSGYICGKALVVPGYVSLFNVLALKFIPHDLLVPIIGWFLRARLTERKDV